MSIAQGEHPLALLAQSPENPFLQEWALLALAKRLLQSNDGLPENGQTIHLHCDNWSLWEDGGALLDDKLDSLIIVLGPPRRRDRRWEVPGFVHSDNQWSYKLGQLLRFALTGQPDFAQTSGLAARRAKLPRYTGVKSHWFKRRYGHFNGQTDFGPYWVPLSDWATNLLSRLLEWPGYTRRSSSIGPDLREKFSLSELQRVINSRLKVLKESFGRSSRIPFYRIRVDWNELHQGQGPDARTLRVAVVQTALPTDLMFEQAPADPTLSRQAIYRRLSDHFSSVLAGLEKMMVVRTTHVDGPSRPHLIIFPELALHPELYWSLLRRFALQWRAMVFVGVVYHPLVPGSDDIINSGYWILPHTTDSDGPNLRVVEQGKAHLMKAEEDFAAAARQSGGGNLRPWRPCQWIIELCDDRRVDPFFSLSACICFDATDLRLATDLRDQKTDAFIVSALNKDVTTFDNMITSMNFHMFQPVMLANNGTYGGSGAQWPISEPRHERTLFHVHGGNQVTVNFFDLDMELIRNRLRGRPAARYKFKSPPAGLKRGRKP